MHPAREAGRNFDRLKDLLREMFQLDRGDLDFGIYRIMNMKAGEIEAFLERDLLPQVKTALAGVADEQRAALQAELDKAVANARSLEVDPETAPPIINLRKQVAEATADADAEADVYDHLAKFFARYYSEGDFMSLRRYSSGGKPTYLIPWDGEEVKLHWANADQYYVKTTENYASYAFTAGEGDAEFRVRFEVAAADNEKDNIKETNGRQRRFVLGEDAVALDGDSLVVRFGHRPLTEREKREWPGNGTRQQDRIDADTTARILTALETLSPAWRPALAAPAPTALDPERSLLAKHVGRYTAKNSFDYFIHKDLGGFLRRELDLYLKTDVLDLQDLALGDSGRLRRALGRMRAVREVGEKLIAFLAQLEDFQKRLWLKKKFVLETQWCVTLDRVPETLWPEIVANEAQWVEWRELFAIDEMAGGTDDDGFLKANPYLVLDTRHFDTDFTERLLSALSEVGSLEGQTDGLLIDGDNLQAQRLIRTRYKGKVQCVYLDPPFNTGLDGFLYKDGYFHSSWLAMMESRIRETNILLPSDGTLYVHIDYTEKERLKLLLDNYFSYITEIIWRIGWVSGYKSAAEKFVRNHDTIYQYGKTEFPLFVKKYIPYPEGYRRRDGNAPSGSGYPLEDTWNCSDLDQLHSIQIMSFSKEKVGNQALTQKNENLVARIIESSSRRGDLVLDYFLGSGTTTAVAQKLGRRYIGIEAGKQFYSYSLPRMKRVLRGDPYGISSDVGWKGGGAFQYIHLESYEDTLDGLVVVPPENLLAENDPALIEDYKLRYALNEETAGSPCLLGRDFRDPFAYTLSVVRDGVRRETPVDLPETFNLLLGLRVESRRRLDGVLAIAGKNPQGQSCLVLWRNLEETDNDALNLWLQRYREALPEALDTIYANGDHTLNSMRQKKDSWKAEVIEPLFRELMFEEEDR